MVHFGPDVIGKKEYEKQLKLEQSGALKYGPDVLDKHPAAAKQAKPAATEPATPPDEVTEPDDSVSVREIKDILRDSGSTATIDRLMTAEFTRPDGARKTALAELLAAEVRRDEPRPYVVSALETKMEEVS